MRNHLCVGPTQFPVGQGDPTLHAPAEVCAAFGVGQSPASAKARVISDALHTNRMDPTWMLRSFVDRNPLVWMAEVNGLLVDLRDMPHEVQVIAYEKGMIPYIPADGDTRVKRLSRGSQRPSELFLAIPRRPSPWHFSPDKSFR